MRLQNGHVIVIHKTCLLKVGNVVGFTYLRICYFNSHLFYISYHISVALNYYVRTVTLRVEALRYKPGVRGFKSQWGHWDFLLT